MRLHFSSTSKHKTKWGTYGARLATAAFATGLVMAVAHPAGATGMTFVVDADGHATNNNCNSATATPYVTVSAAITAAGAGDTVKVCPGSYTENVMIDKKLTVKGAQAGEDVEDRTFGDADESKITGLVTINAADVKLNGFSLTNPGQGLGVLVKVAGDNAVVTKNIIKTVGSNVFTSPTVGVYLELGPDGVTVSGNAISDIQSQTKSAQGVLVGDSTSANPSLNTRIDRNMISDITSVSRGAYGVQVNNGSDSALTSTGYAEVKIRGNTIKNLTGSWAHGIGMEGETPEYVVGHNTISSLTSGASVGVFFEDNAFFFTGEVNHNSLDVGATSWGIAVATALSTHYPSLNVDGTCNWWGAANGPSTVGTGSGSQVGPNVDYKPWLKHANINKDCGDDDHHGWSEWAHDDWHND